jgi:formamidopyrimidine-DNA glycosylase
MPELPEVEITVRGLATVLAGEQIASIATRREALRKPFPADLRQRLTGARITRLHRRAKYGLIDSDRGDTLIFHLGMTGTWRVDIGEPAKHDHLLIETGGGRKLALNDPRRFGFVELVMTTALDRYPPFMLMGPEPLGARLTADYLVTALAGRQAGIKLLLLDQRIVAGLGNIYVCEALNIARINPATPGGQLKRNRLAALIVAIRQVLERSIALGGSTIRDYIRPDGELGYFASEWRVYDRAGAACPCGGTVLRKPEGGRSTFYCSKCQR